MTAKNKKIMESLLKEEGAIVERKDPHQYVIRSPSPSVNHIFGKGYGLPAGYSMVLYGPPKGGKTLLSNAMAGQLHKDDDEAWVAKFDTEMREEGQLSEDQMATWGIDPDRYIPYMVNRPDQIFDRIEKTLAATIEDKGMKLKLVIIDSVNGIQGRRSMNADSIMTQQIGDNAMTIQEGLKRILPIQRKYRFALILISQIRAQMDIVEQMRGNKIKPAISFATQHHCEYYVLVEPNKSKE